MSRNRIQLILQLMFVLSFAFLGLVPTAIATTECDTDESAVEFEATVDPMLLNDLLSSLDTQEFNLGGGLDFWFPGLCVRHHITISASAFTVLVDEAPFTVTPSSGTIQVDLELAGPFLAALGAGGYYYSHCSDLCKIEVPHVGGIDGCAIEGSTVGPILEAGAASASWDDITVTQIADTCVLGDCTAVHPLESTTADLIGFDIDFTGFGSCEVCLPFPFPLDELFDDLCLDLCAGLDPLIGAGLQPLAEDLIAQLFNGQDGNGLLIEVFSRQIVKDGCSEIDEVLECRQAASPATAGLVRSPKSRRLNALFYLVPIAVAAGLSLRLRRRRR